MKILHITGGNINSGAFKGVYYLHNALKKKSIKSNIFNLDYLSIKNNRNFFFKIFKFYLSLNILFDKLPKLFYPNRSNSSFSSNNFGLDVTKFNIYKDSDIIHLHWVNNGHLPIKILKKIDKPILWTVRDMWPYTGGCHYSLSCKKYMSYCGSCPILKSKKTKDISWRNYLNKKLYFKKIDHVVTISNWLNKDLKKSKIFNIKNITTIYNGISKNTFFPIKKEVARKELKILTNKKIILYGADNFHSEVKGYKYFLKMLNYLDNRKYYLIFFGHVWDLNEVIKKKFEFKNFYFVNNEKTLRKIYSAADLSVFPSLQEAFGKTALESIFCGTPTVCFEKTGMAEIIIHKKNGFLSRYKNTKDLSVGVDWVIKNKKKLNLKKNINNFEIENISKRYYSLYKKILKNKKDIN